MLAGKDAGAPSVAHIAGSAVQSATTLLVLLGFLSTAPPDLFAQPVPHHFDNITALPDHTISLSLDGSVSNMFPNLPVAISNQFMQMFDLYAVEASVNLNDWTPLALVLRTNNNPSPLNVQDTNAAALPQRFYRTFTNHLPTGFLKPSGPFAVGTAPYSRQRRGS